MDLFKKLGLFRWVLVPGPDLITIISKFSVKTDTKFYNSES